MSAPTGLAERWLRLDIQSYWHPGTGRGDGAAADAVVLQGQDGLPMLPGRTVKGLLRAAFRLGVEAGMATEAEELDLFGSRLAEPQRGAGSSSADPSVNADNRVRVLEEARFGTSPGRIRVESATLGETRALRRQWRAYGEGAPRSQEGALTLARLKRSFASTKLDDGGVASDATLRTIELYVPMTLFAPVRVQAGAGKDLNSDVLLKKLDESAQLFLRGLGSHRNRGLGRCAARFEVPRD